MKTKAAEEIRYGTGESSLGLVLVAESANGVCAILLGEALPVLLGDLQRRFPRACLTEGVSRAVVRAVLRLVETPGESWTLPLDARGTLFQQAVWQALRGIPAGETVSYMEVARRVGRPDAVRAVAQAIGANPLAVVVPCHRVIGSDGSLTGYHWGLEIKRALLAREAEG